MNLAERSLEELVGQVPVPTADRFLLGVVGPPGAGKSTIAQALVERLSARDAGGWRLLGMDGFHLSNSVLHSLGRRDRKGAPDTFDVAGFVNLLRRLRSAEDGEIYLPVFHREIEESIAAEVGIDPAARGIVVEGNYLLHAEHGWQAVRHELDACWYLDADAELRHRRLVERASATYGSREAGEQWVRTVDAPNAALIERGMADADLVFRVGDIGG